MKQISLVDKNLQRYPIIALSYKEKYKAVPKELVIDYDNGRLYIRGDNGKFFEVTMSINANSIYVETDKGIMNLTDLLMEYSINRLKVREVREMSFYRLPNDLQFDLSSIIPKNNKIMVYGFEDAQEGMIPTKVNGKIGWVTREILIGDGENLDPGETGEILDVLVVGGIVHLVPGKYQRTNNVNIPIEVEMPTVTMQHNRMRWKLSCGASPATISMIGDVSWEYTNDFQPQPNKNQFYEFETWDGGLSWYASVSRYNKSGSELTQEFIANNYFNKNDIVNMMSWDTGE